MSDMVQEAITSKTSIMLSAIATFCAAFIVAFVMYWTLALILSPFFVAMFLIFSVVVPISLSIKSNHESCTVTQLVFPKKRSVLLDK